MTVALRAKSAPPVEIQLESRLEAMLSSGSGPVGDAMRYAVLGAGQRLRPALSLRVASVLGAPRESVLGAASAVELLHCASLIVDDLPCMDDELVRRNRPCVHREFGEAVAVLAAFALVSLAARAVARHPGFQLRLLETLDCNALIGGQALDLDSAGVSRDFDRARVTNMKTVPLFELAVEAGCLGGGATFPERERLIRFGREFGAAYQLLDDWLDAEITDASLVEERFAHARDLLRPLGQRAAPLLDMVDRLNAKLWEENSGNR